MRVRYAKHLVIIGTAGALFAAGGGVAYAFLGGGQSSSNTGTGTLVAVQPFVVAFNDPDPQGPFALGVPTTLHIKVTNPNPSQPLHLMRVRVSPAPEWDTAHCGAVTGPSSVLVAPDHVIVDAANPGGSTVAPGASTVADVDVTLKDDPGTDQSACQLKLVATANPTA